jgi:hypothetical protein
MKRWYIKLCFVLILANNALVGQSPRQEVAQEYLKKCWKNIPDKFKNDYGFDTSDSLRDISLGEPFNIFKITPAAIENYKEGDSTGSLLTKTNLWYFPVMLKEESKAYVIVDKMGDTYKAVSFGYTNLAKGINVIKQNWPASKGHNIKICIAYETQTCLYTIPEINNHNLSTIEMSGKKYLRKSTDAIRDNTIDDLSVTMKQLKKYSRLR